MHKPSLAEEFVELAIEENTASGDGGDRSVYCHGCRRISEVLDPHLPMCPLCCSDQVDFIDSEPSSADLSLPQTNGEDDGLNPGGSLLEEVM